MAVGGAMALEEGQPVVQAGPRKPWSCGGQIFGRAGRPPPPRHVHMHRNSPLTRC